MAGLHELKIKIFADGAELPMIKELCKNPLIKGFTTNPTLMHKARICDYRTFASEVLKLVADHPISFEVFSDDFAEMEEQALEISSWGKNVYVKIPVSNTRGEFSGPLIRRLSRRGVQLNVTALLTVDQVARVAACLSQNTGSFVSLFAGRVADTGRDPEPMIAKAVDILRRCPHTELIWASPRELLNIFQADRAGCPVITVTTDLLAKLPLIGKDLDQFSLETVRMFREDALKAGLALDFSEAELARSALVH